MSGDNPDKCILAEKVGEGLRSTVKELVSRHELRTSEIIETEMRAAYLFLKKNRIEGAETLNELYLCPKKPVIKETAAVKKLAEDYEAEAEKVGIASAKKMKPDFTIVASATLGSADFILTLNRKTMASEFASLVYSVVNTKRRLKTPEFVSGKESIRRFAYV